jgi:hypothetical protein
MNAVTAIRLGVSTLTIIDERKRMSFLPNNFGPDMMQIEGRIYSYASKLLDGYTGGYWEFANAGNGAPVLIPPAGDSGKISGGYEWRYTEFTSAGGTLSREASGLALTCLAVNHQANARPNSPNCAPLCAIYYKLMDAIYEHAERDTLLSILD